MNLNKQMVTKELLLKNISDIDIYKCYAPDIEIELNKRMLSPLRTEKDPSFTFFSRDGSILFNDFILGGGDCIRFVQKKFGDNYFEALSRIVIDFKLTDKYYYRNVNASSIPQQHNINREELLSANKGSFIQKKRREWTFKDIAFWKQFGIDYKTLKKYHVEPLSHIFINDNIITCDDLTYAYIELKDGIETYKIYQPFKEDFKWINNHDDSVWQGWAQLPEEGQELIITKSLKDVMTIDCITGIPAVSLQAESVKPKQHIIDELKERFTIIWLWYDNDFDKEVNWGRQFSKELASEYNLLRIEIPDKYQIKDPSDFCKVKGIEVTKDLIEELISVPF